MRLADFYRSDEWFNLTTQLKLERISDDDILYCEHCGKPIVKAYDCIAHHKIELTESNVNDYNISLNPDNIMLIHHRCHNIIHERWGHEQMKRVYCVYGAPCSGKTTWVHDNAGKEDLILDIDSIWQMISVNDRYVKPNRLKTNVFMVRDCILDMIKCRTGKWKNAYIIGGYPLAMDRYRLQQQTGCEFIFIDESRETCLARARSSEWINYINDWFEKFSA